MSEINIDPHLLQAAIKALGITAPIYAARYTNAGDVVITTRAGVLIWRPGAAELEPSEPVPFDNLTVIPQVGQATQANLNTLGIFTFEQLAAADADLLLSIMTPRTLRCIVQYLHVNFAGLKAGWKTKET